MRLPSRLVCAALASLLAIGLAATVAAAEPEDAGAAEGSVDDEGDAGATGEDDAGAKAEDDASAKSEDDAGATAEADTAAADTVDQAALEKARCRPTDIIFLIDNSASFTGARAQVRAYAEGAREFLETLGEQHRISMIKFGEGADVMVEPSFNTPENRDTLVNAIEDLSMKEPWTNVYAGVDLAFRKIRVDEDRRGVILMISDGVISMPGPNGRESEEVKAQQKEWIASRLPDARKEKAFFYTVAYENRFTDYELMQKIADETGGFSAKGDNASLAATMRKVAVEMCARDPIPVRRAVVPPVAVPATPPVAPPPTPVTLTPPAPVPVGAPIGLIVALAGAGVAVVGTGTFLMMRSRRRREAALAGGGGGVPTDAFSSGEMVAAGAGVAAGGAAMAARSRRDRDQRQGAAADDRYFTRSNTVTMEAVPEPAHRGKPSSKRGDGGGELRGGPRGSSSSSDQGSGRSTPGSASPPSIAIERGETPARRGPPPKPPGWGEVHMMRVIGFTTGGKEIKEVDFRRDGDVVVAVGTGAGAVIPIPPEKGNIRGTVIYNVMPDGTRIVRIKEIPPGGFRDRTTGVALREGDVLSNNQKIEWVKEDRGRYFEIFYK